MSTAGFAPQAAGATGAGQHTASAPAIVIVGAGPAGLMAAEILAAAGLRVRVFDRMPSPARKFLMAGRGGLNLTHSEPLSVFLTRYGPMGSPVPAFVESFPPDALRNWAAGLGQRTFVGSSGRVFPEAFKASPLLRAWLQRLSGLGVELHLRQRWLGWTETNELLFEDTVSGRRHQIQAVATILALGGASWPRLGSDGAWIEILTRAGCPVTPLGPFNAGALVTWSRHLIDRFAGTPLKRISLTCDGRTVRGEAVITRSGLEGGCVYAMNDAIREQFLNAESGRVELFLDLRPDLDLQQLTEKLNARRNRQSIATFLRRQAGLSPAAIALAREPDGTLPATAAGLAAHLKAIRLEVTGLSALDRAISTSGGLAWSALDNTLMLRNRPGTFCAGEMLDWYAPTGGYLLQGVFASAVVVARNVMAWLHRDTSQLGESLTNEIT